MFPAELSRTIVALSGVTSETHAAIITLAVILLYVLFVVILSGGILYAWKLLENGKNPSASRPHRKGAVFKSRN